MQQQNSEAIGSAPMQSALEDIQQMIQASLYTKMQLKKKTRSDLYFDELCHALRFRGRLGLLRLCWLPLDDDFIRLAYHVILGRGAEPGGFAGLHTALLTRSATRLDIALSLVHSPEAVAWRTNEVTGLRYLIPALKIRRIIGRIPLGNYVAWSTWRFLTSAQRLQRIEMQNFDALDDNREVRLMVNDMVEYLHNTRLHVDRGTRR